MWDAVLCIFCFIKELFWGDSLVVQWLGDCTFTDEILGSIPGQGTKIPHTKMGTPPKKTHYWMLSSIYDFNVLGTSDTQPPNCDNWDVNRQSQCPLEHKIAPAGNHLPRSTSFFLCTEIKAVCVCVCVFN